MKNTQTSCMINTKYYFSVLVGLSPLLSNYKSIIPGIDLCTFILIFFVIINPPKKIMLKKSAFFVLYLLLLSIVTPIVNKDLYVSIKTLALRQGKLMFYLVIALLFEYNEKYLDEFTLFKTIRFGVYVSTVIVTIQLLSRNIFGITYVNPLLKYSINDVYYNIDIYEKMKVFRPSALFLEPLGMSFYNCIFLVYSLFKCNNIKDSLIASIGMIFTGSAGGLSILLFVYGIYIFIKFKKNIIKLIVTVIIFLVIIYALYKVPYVQYAVNRVITSNIEYGGNALEGRIGKGLIIFSEKSIFFKLFGNGYGNIIPNIYFNGFSYSMNTIGILGTSLYFDALFCNFNIMRLWKKVLSLIFFILFFFVQLLSPSNCFIIFILLNNKNHKDENAVCDYLSKIS